MIRRLLAADSCWHLQVPAAYIERLDLVPKVDKAQLSVLDILVHGNAAARGLKVGQVYWSQAPLYIKCFVYFIFSVCSGFHYSVGTRTFSMSEIQLFRAYTLSLRWSHIFDISRPGAAIG